MIRKYSFRKLRGVGLVSCVIGFTLISGVIQQDFNRKESIVNAETSSTESTTLSDLISTRVQKGILNSKLTNSSDFTVDSSVTQDKLPAIQAIKDVYDKLPDSYKRIVQGVHFINQEDGILGATDATRNTYIRANYLHPDLHPDFSDAYELFFHEIAHSIDFLSYSNDNGQETSISRSEEVSSLLKNYSNASVYESFASTFGAWLQSKVMDKQPSDATEQTLWNLYDRYFNNVLFNTPSSYDEVENTTFNWVGHFKDEQGNLLRPDITLSNNYSRTITYANNQPQVGDWTFLNRQSNGMDDLNLQTNKFNYLNTDGIADAWSVFTVPAKIGDKYLFKSGNDNLSKIGIPLLFTWQDKIYTEIGKQANEVNGETTWYYKEKNAKITLNLVDYNDNSKIYSTNQQFGFYNYASNPLDTSVFKQYESLGQIVDSIPSTVELNNEDLTINVRIKINHDLSNLQKEYTIYQWDNLQQVLDNNKISNKNIDKIDLTTNVDTSIVTEGKEPINASIKVTFKDGYSEDVPIKVNIKNRTIFRSEQQWRTIEYRFPDGTTEFHYQAILDYYKNVVDFVTYKLPYGANLLNEEHIGVRYVEDADNAYYTDKLSNFNVPQYEGYISYVNGVASKALPKFSSKSVSTNFNNSVRIGNFLQGNPTMDDLDVYSYRTDTNIVVEYKENNNFKSNEHTIGLPNVPNITILARDNTNTVQENGYTNWESTKERPIDSFAPYFANQDEERRYENNGALWYASKTTSKNSIIDKYIYNSPQYIGDRSSNLNLNIKYLSNEAKTKFKLEDLTLSKDTVSSEPIIVKPNIDGYRTFISTDYDSDSYLGQNGINSLLTLKEVDKDTTYSINTSLSNEQLETVKEYFKDKVYKSYHELESELSDYIYKNLFTNNIEDFKDGNNTDKLLMPTPYLFYNVKFPDSNVTPQNINQGDTVDYSKAIDNYSSFEVVKDIDNMKLGNQTTILKVTYSDGSSRTKEVPVTVNKVLVDKEIPMEFKRIITVNMPNGEKNVVTQVVNGLKTVKVNKFDENDIVSDGEITLDKETFESYQPTEIKGYSTPKADELKVDTSKQVVELELNYEKINSEPKNDDIKNPPSSDNKDTEQENKDLTKTITNENTNSNKSDAKKVSQTEKDLPQTNYSSSDKALTYGGLGIVASVLSILGITKLKRKQHK